MRRLLQELRHPFITVATRPLTEDERVMIVRIMLILAIPIAFISLLPAAGLGIYAIHESHVRSNQNRALINQLRIDEARLKFVVDSQSKARSENRKRFAASDLTICKRVEDLKTEFRVSTRYNDASTKLTLRQLGIDPNSPHGRQLIARSKKAAAVLQRRFHASRCSALPSAKATEPKS